MAIAAPFDLVFVAVKTTQTEAIAPLADGPVFP